MNGKISKSFVLTSGIPQGSHMSGLLFILFINDLKQYVKHSELFMYMDDAKIALEIDTIDDCKKITRRY